MLVDFERRPADDVSIAEAAASPDSAETSPLDTYDTTGGEAGSCVLGRAVLGVCRLPTSRK